MLYRCKCCQYSEGRGVLPGVTCGLFILAQMTIAAFIVGALIPKGFLSGLGPWKWLGLPLLPVVAFFGALILNWLLEAIEWLAFCLRKCPQCGKRRWSWGYTGGFGL